MAPLGQEPCCGQQGCVRMLNDHMRQLFDVVEVGTPLDISD